MKRHRRSFHESGHAHALTFSCYRRFPFFKTDRACHWLKDAIDSARTDESFKLWAYVIMPDHVHLVVAPEDFEGEIGRILKAIKAPVARKAIAYLKQYSPEWLDKVTRTRGTRQEHLFWQSGGGYDRNVIQPGTLLSVIDYIHANPVRKGLVERPQDWSWSSGAWFINRSEVPIAVDPIPVDWLE